ncbi:PrgI family mobile element protein [Nitrolancea hollandica]|nr:PrgI family protein [Nitrolancea hollandica]
MAHRRHEIPTHLNVEDTVFLGLRVRQVLFLVSGCAAGYQLWAQWPELPLALRLALALTCLVVAFAIALVRPQGRGLEEWAIVTLRYALVPNRTVWRPREFVWTGESAPQTGWEEFSPRINWKELQP